MFRFYIIFLAVACSALRYTLASPIGDLASFNPASHVSSMDSPPPLPPIQYTLGRDDQIRNRKLLAPQPAVMEMIPDAVDRHGNKVRKPSEEQSVLIENFFKEQQAKKQFGGQIWRLTKDKFRRLIKPKDTLRYLCGRNEVLDEDGYLIYSTGFCNHDKQFLSGICCSSDNVAERGVCISSAVLGALSGFTALLGSAEAAKCFCNKCSDALDWMDEKVFKAEKSIPMSRSNAVLPVHESGSVVKERLPETSAPSEERMEMDIPSAAESTGTAPRGHGKGPFKFTQL
ncbi:hypothetical protein MJO28_000053 [Puccinia striiformis f. sp. tritici]|uniref:Uncharacterized protein n=3 Tax=Puccinia striiformis TaxID=27350 RepID=A0A0L0UUR2_9BASI|nr:hypothetical protein Pst134EA_001152 [Puccinia striiformis f. sp. tritici]KNE90765.1 hypothetical protein PSTG_15773 [Puccinia striiformis f. sp. tritici PST-78]POW11967.1 hypothetical protein PSHT_08248 [Puccinia striiformis]KAH9474107.1 hypothetical protein Pst134EA_001152 [Puccinia striiformis f. sp. tritici]KAI7961959.1 hypothetical protein MJO28_000053 [Puccinia striiformis f. sp. tritici]KAI7967898.1 hypothetical protein MJO29_001175 [Puccinia striiformis f. sp. tritici]